MPKQYFHGKTIGYKIIYHPVGLERKAISFSVNYTTNSTTLKDLTVYTVYVINISAVSSGGVGPGNMTMAQTDAGGTEVLKKRYTKDLVTMTKQKFLFPIYSTVSVD